MTFRHVAVIGLISTAILLSSVIMSSASYDKNTVTAEITEYGIYEQINEGRKYPEANSTAGYARDRVTNRLKKVTTEIPLSRGVIFGFDWVAKGFPSNSLTKFIRHIKHPPTIKPSGELKTYFKDTVKYIPEMGTIKGGEYYRLSEDWELLPGTWSFSLIYEGRILVEKTFNVISTDKNQK